MAGGMVSKDYNIGFSSNGLSRNVTITAKINQKEHERINKIVSRLGITKSSFIREAVMAVVELLESSQCNLRGTDGIDTFLEKLIKICNNNNK